MPCKKVFNSYWRPQGLGISLDSLLKFHHTSHLNHCRINLHLLVFITPFPNRLNDPFVSSIFSPYLCPVATIFLSCLLGMPDRLNKESSCHKAFSSLLFVYVYFTSFYTLFLFTLYYFNKYHPISWLFNVPIWVTLVPSKFGYF